MKTLLRKILSAILVAVLAITTALLATGIYASSRWGIGAAILFFGVLIAAMIAMSTATWAAMRPFALLVLAFALGTIGWNIWLCGGAPGPDERRELVNLGFFSLLLPLWLWLRRSSWRGLVGATWPEAGRSGALLALAGAVALIVVLTAWAALPASVDLAPLLSWTLTDRRWERTFVFLAFPPWLGLTLFLWRWLVRWQSRRLLAATAIATAAVLVYLAWDNPTTAPLPAMDQLAPLPPGATASDAIYRSLKSHPARNTLVVQARSWELDPTSDRWRLFVAANRTLIRTAWDADPTARVWVDQLDGFDVVGDLSAQGGPRRPRVIPLALEGVVLQHCAFATLQAIEGRGDEALAVLQPALSVSRKLQVGACSSGRLEQARDWQHWNQATARLIVASTSVRRESLVRLVERLRPASGVGAIDARILLVETQLIRQRILQRFTAHVPWLGGPVGLFLYRPHATINLYTERCTQLAADLKEGRGEEIRAKGPEWWNSRSFRNSVGRLVLGRDDQQYLARLKHAWAIDDQRRALLAEVQQRLVAADGATPTPAQTAPPAAPPRAK